MPRVTHHACRIGIVRFDGCKLPTRLSCVESNRLGGRRRMRPSLPNDAWKASLSRHPGNVSRPNACLVPAGSSGNDEIRGKVFPVVGPPRFFLSIPGPGRVRSDNHLKWIDVENPGDCETDFVVEYADPAPVAAHCSARNAEGFRYGVIRPQIQLVFHCVQISKNRFHDPFHLVFFF